MKHKQLLIGDFPGCVAFFIMGWIIFGLVIGGFAMLVSKNEPAISSSIHTLRAAQFAWQMDRLYDSLPDQPLEIKDGGMITDDVYIQWDVVTNSKELEQVIEVVLPYVEYEFGMRPLRPDMVAFVPFVGKDSFHLLGRASCEHYLFIVNYGYVNPFGHLYRRDTLLPTIVHELLHTQGLCGQPSEVMEAATELASAEVLAAMSNHGNKYAIKPLVGHLRDWSLAYVRTMARASGRADWYRWFVLNFIYTEPKERARMEKSWQFWDNHSDDYMNLDYILVAYGMRPWWRLQQALAFEGYRTPRDFWEYPNATGRIQLDDLAYFLDNLPLMARIARE